MMPPSTSRIDFPLLGLFALFLTLGWLSACKEQVDLDALNEPSKPVANQPAAVDHPTGTPQDTAAAVTAAPVTFTAPNGSTLVAPAGTPVRITHRIQQDDTGYARGGRSSATGKNVEGATAGKPGAIVFAPIGGKQTSGIKGGAFSSQWAAVGASQGVIALYVLGAVLLIAAGAVFYFTRNLAGTAILGCTGLLLIACGVVAEEYPWVFLIAIVGLLAVTGWGIYAMIREHRQVVAVKGKVTELDTTATNQEITLKSLIQSVAALADTETPEGGITYAEAADKLKGYISYYTDSTDDDTVKKVVRGIKHKTGVVKPRAVLPPTRK